MPPWTWPYLWAAIALSCLTYGAQAAPAGWCEETPGQGRCV